MNVINLLKNILLKSQIYVSLCATLLGVFILQEQESYQNTLAFVLFLTFWNGYFFTVYHRRKFAKIWNILGFVLISSILLKYFELNFFLKWLIVLILGFIYNADFLNINLRQFSLVKTFYVGFIWALSLVWFPLKEMNWAWFFIIFFYTSAITFPFEIRDLKRDDFPTLPMKIGIQNTKYLSYLFLFICSFLTIKFLKLDYALAFSINAVLAAILVYFSHQKRADWYYSFLMESLSVMPFIFHELFKIF